MVVFLRFPSLLILQRTFKDVKTNKAAFQRTVPYRDFVFRFQSDMFQGHGVVGDEPALEALEVVLQRAADFLIELVDVVFLEAVAVGRVDDHDAAAFGRGEVVHVLLHHMDVVLQAGVVDVALGNGDGLRLAV